MEYKNIVKGKFISRPNRFIAEVEINGETVRCHVKNTGRCRELLIPGTDVYMEDFAGRMRSRRLRYSLIAVTKGNTLINMDSQAPNKVIAEALHSGTIQLPEMSELKAIKAEKTYGSSRLDFYVEDICGRKGFIEVKGVTLEEDGIAMFPDAPTERGVRHTEELCKAVSDERHRAFYTQLQNPRRLWRVSEESVCMRCSHIMLRLPCNTRLNNCRKPCKAETIRQF